MKQSGFILRLRRQTFMIHFTIFVVVVVLIFIFTPVLSLTDGPSQPETKKFEPLGLQQHVDMFSGEFNYSIPLFDVGPYPFQLSYNSNIVMEEEASWVGLGWNLNTGSVSRNMRGFPDDFNRDTIIEEKNQKKNINVAVSFNVFDPELFTIELSDLTQKLIKKLLNSLSINASSGVSFVYNNYSGISFSRSSSIGLNLTGNNSFGLKSNIGYSTGDGGLTISPSMSFDKLDKDNYRNSLFSYGAMGFSYNSMKGIHQMNFGFYSNKLKLSSSNSELSFPPSSPFPYRNTSFAFNPKCDFTLVFADLGISISASYGVQKLAVNQINAPAFGYLYMNGKTGSNGELLDYSREKDNAYMPGNPYLPQTFLQPDIFSINTPFISDNFRAFQNSAPAVSSPALINGSDQVDIGFGIELGGGNASDYGGNVTLNMSTTSTGPWILDNSAYGNGTSVSSFAASTFHRNIYFKSMSSNARSPITSLNTQPQSFNISGNDFSYSLSNNASVFTGKYGNYLNVRERICYQPLIKDIFTRHPLYSEMYEKYESTSQKSHHIAAFKVKDDEGNIFMFGCPAVNHLQKDIAFNVEGPNNNNSLYIAYTSGDASTGNQKGLTNYYSSKLTPAYAYAYMLTDMYTSEYRDLKGDGPSPDDPGDYVVFSYSKKIERYKWRTPYTKDEFLASYNQNILSSYNATSDDIGSYSYGEKDIWYIDTVRSKHQMALFYTSEREDAYEAKSEHGGKGNRSMHKLDSVVIFNTHNYYQSLQQGIQPIADKKVTFIYNYKLCKGVYNQANQNKGKLTLMEVVITDFNSKVGFKHSYLFNYSNTNPGYNPMNTNRWGNYDDSSPAGMNNLDFPYTTNNDTLFSGAWRLNQIQLPSGGKINVEYEPEKYRYVQDKPAMQMFQIAGVSNSASSYGNNLHNGSFNDDNYLFFETDIPTSLPNNEAQQEFSRYFDDAVRNNLYFKVIANISPSGQHKDAVFGFAEIEDAALIVLNGKYYGRIKLKAIPIGKKSANKNVNPITKAAIHFGIINTPRLTNGHPDLNSYIDDPFDFVNHLIQDYFINTSVLNNIITMIQGPQKKLYNDGIGKTIEPEKSYIRLLSRSDKLTGGSRVKRIIYDNSWGTMSPGEAGSTIIKEYTYLNTEGYCSGVASYEPQIGADEIPQHLPYTYNYQTKTHSIESWARNLVPQVDYMGLLPLCETAFPSPSVGYGRVVETTKGQNNVSNGHIATEFYTTKDYPTLVYSVPLNEKTPKMEMYLIFYSIEKKHCAVSQGFSVVTNDMNGREKKVEYYDGYNRLLKRIKNQYSPKGASGFYSNINSVFGGYKGLEKDVVVDFREELSITSGEELMLNSNTTVLVTPLALLTALGSFNYSEIMFRSATVNTVWYQKANLVKQIVEDRGANLSVHNVYHDPITGKPLITSLVNSWGKKSWSYELPAYFVYPQMGPASCFSGHNLKLSTNLSGRIITSSTPPLNDGDMLMLFLPQTIFAWVLKDENNNRYLIDQNGAPLNSLSDITAYIYDSGRKNFLNPVTQSISTKESPVSSGAYLDVFSASHGIMSAAATVFSDYYSFRCADCDCVNEIREDSILVYVGAKSSQPIYIPYYIKESCVCDGAVIFNVPDSLNLFFYWPAYNRWCNHIFFICSGVDLTLEVYADTTLAPIGTYSITVPGSTAINFTFQHSLNPFLYKLKNAWAPKENYVFVSGRTPVNTSDDVRLAEQGQYNNFVPFWYYTNGWSNNKDQWLLTERNTYTDLSGNPVESRNIINNYNAATYSHKGYLNESVAVNARSHEVAADCFEDYYPFYVNASGQPWQHSVLPQFNEHFRLVHDKPQLVSLENPHTGYYSLKIPQDTTIRKTVKIKVSVPDTMAVVSMPPPYMVQQVHCSDVFAPSPDKKYLVSFWVNTQDTVSAGLIFSVSVYGFPANLEIEYISPFIEGWRQYSYSFSISARICFSLDFIIKNNRMHPVFLDDFRVHPYNSSMNVYVYNPFTHQLMATLNENNFAVMYQYDAQQQVQNAIKETEKGRMYVNYRLKHLFRN